ncbi:MAG TPA: hypothetical protein VGR88_10445 [Ktedonobacterales bacterium]|nr:hypothetical protein [Ktedonobacterales bacterium]
MTRTGVLLRIDCKKGQVVVTEDRVYCQGRAPTSDEVWSVPRARIAGVRTHSGLLLAELDVRTSDGEAYTAPGVGALDALRAMDLLGYSRDPAAEPPAPPTEGHALELVCDAARLRVTDTEVEWTGARPWRLQRKEIAGVTPRTSPPIADLTFHTYRGRICRAHDVPLYGAIHVIELLGYAPDDSARRARIGCDAASGDATRSPRTAYPGHDRAYSVHATRRTVRNAPRTARQRRRNAPADERGRQAKRRPAKQGQQPTKTARQRATTPRKHIPPFGWLVAMVAAFSHLMPRRTQKA